MGHGELQVILLVGVRGGAAGEERPPQKGGGAALVFQVGAVQAQAGLPAGVAKLQEHGLPGALVRQADPVGGLPAADDPEGQLPGDAGPRGGQLQKPAGHSAVLRDKGGFLPGEAPGEQPGPVALRPQAALPLELHLAQLGFDVG